jgi:ribonuclease HI
MGGSKMEGKPFVGFTSIYIKDGHSMKFRISKIVSTFTPEALAIGETLEIIEKIDSEQNFTIFSDSVSVLKGISNSSKMNNTSHITQMLKNQIERLESREKITQFYWIPGHCGIDVNERADSG